MSSNEIAVLKLALPGHPTGEDAVELMSVLRDEHIPSAFSGVAAEVNVGGQSAASAEIFDVVDQYTPIVFTFVLGFSFMVLLLVFRSIVIPIKAVIMNLLSVGTAYGLLVLVFQKGFAADLFGFQHAEVIDAWIPLFLFTILFGLSMDYHVFLLSRVRERFDQTGDNTEAVSYGLRSTANLITGAALIMVAVFGAFASGKTIINQQVGFGLAVAILLDATLVRSVLVPASMEMLGRGNWYLPSWLSWLPDLRVRSRGLSSCFAPAHVWRRISYMKIAMKIPSDNVAGYELACEIDREVATNYVAHTYVCDPTADEFDGRPCRSGASRGTRTSTRRYGPRRPGHQKRSRRHRRFL